MTNLNTFVPPNISSIVDVVRDFGAVGDAVIAADGTVTGTDNTAAFQAALNAAIPSPANSYNFGHWLYIPPGVYMVSDRLDFKGSTGTYGCCVRVIGAHIDQSEVVLKHASSGYSSSGSPKPLFFTASQGTAQSATAFRNAFYNLTITVGASNPGAIAVDMNVSNTGGMRHCRIRSVDPARAGVTGLALTRAWPGPAYCADVTVEGFNYGVDIAQQQYSVTFEHLKVINQVVAGVRNTSNLLPIRDLISVQSAGVPAVLNADTAAMTTVIEGDLSGVNGTSAIDNSIGGIVRFRNIRSSGYTNKLANKIPGGSTVDLYTPSQLGDLDEFVNGSVTTLFSGQRLISLRLPAMEAPEYVDSNPADWANVMDYGATHSSTDCSAAIQAAMNSGASTIYFPASPGGQSTENCVFTLKAGVTIPPTVKRIIGQQSVFVSSAWPDGNTNAFTILDGTDDPLFIDGVTCSSSASGEFISNSYSDAVVNSGSNQITSASASFTTAWIGRAVADRTNDATTCFPAGTLITGVPDANTLQVSNNATATGTRLILTGNNIDINNGLKGAHWIEHNSRRPLIMSECTFTGGNLGAVFRSGCGYVHMLGCLLSFTQEAGTRVWCRGHNMELTPNRRILNQGGDLWVFGLKIEKYGTIIKTTNGGRTELEGGFNLPTGGDWSQQPAFECIDSQHSLSFTGLAFQQYHAFFDPQVRETKAGVTHDLAHSATAKRANGWTDVVPLHVGRLV